MAITLNLRPTAIIFPSSNPPSVSSASSVSLKNPSKSAFLSPIPSAIFHHLKPPPTLTRRLLLPSVSGIWDALTGGSNNAREAVLSIRRGMLLFRFEEGAEQFRLDVAQNPNDTEESIWCFLCEAQLYGVDEARKRFLEVGSDRRPVMRAAYNMFKDGGDPEKVVAAFSQGRENESFYASLYAGLYYESQKVLVFLNGSGSLKSFGLEFLPLRLFPFMEPVHRKNEEGAKHHIVAACQSPYGQRSDDYMASLAKVHYLCRNWVSQ
ncbi:uncharacterized protein LOC129320669 isoform X3 [Prosopis cineraria]|uniref:uncharacterized protein LOC129320669 isoform X3 n=1 Tax=Prosopis cineraria TaxID=364024 RepID=UPI0024100EF8|nr:uncharacterized protein LOC129320669 isoform X3 [Prosopis cineraria]